MKCGSIYTPDQLGNGKKFEAPKFVTAHAKCLHQVWLRCPTLPLPLENNWEVHKMAFAKRCSMWWKDNTGDRFLQKINLLIATLGVHYHGHADVNAKLTPACKAWLKQNQKQFNDPRAFADFALGLEVWMPASIVNCPTG